LEAGLESKSSVDAAGEALESAIKAVDKAVFALDTEWIAFKNKVGLEPESRVELLDDFEYKPIEVDLDESIVYAMENKDNIVNAEEAVEDARVALEVAKQVSTPVDIEKAEIALRKAEISLENARSNVTVSVRNAYAALNGAMDSVTNNEEAIADAGESLQRVQAKFEVGLATSTELADAETAVESARRAYAQSVYTFNMQKASFYSTIGQEYSVVDDLIGEASGE